MREICTSGLTRGEATNVPPLLYRETSFQRLCGSIQTLLSSQARNQERKSLHECIEEENSINPPVAAWLGLGVVYRLAERYCPHSRKATIAGASECQAADTLFDRRFDRQERFGRW